MFTLLFNEPLVFFTWVLAFLIALSVHEFSHALVGNLLGDSTAKRLGRLTLNPAAHIDWIGLIAVLLIGFGWGKPVPYNPYSLKWPKWGPVFIAFAGPVSNLIFASVSLLLLSVFGPSLGFNNLLTIFLLVSSQLNVALLAFNLIPLPPLDGSKVLLAIFDGPQYAAFRFKLEAQGPYFLLMLIFADSFLHLGLFSGLIRLVWNLLGYVFPIPAFLL
ncbi:site-2 protease family protein [Candidatus Uhrbacteria bacterium]|nr:site-2 protease family protein [Candidatus Uhrbacteria bacterium]